MKGNKVCLKKKKRKKWQYGFGRERYNNLSEDKKQKLVEYRNSYYEMRKMVYYNYEKLISSRKIVILSQVCAN